HYNNLIFLAESRQLTAESFFMFEKLANIFRIPDLRKRILFTLGLLAVYRLGGHIPTPGVNADKLQQFFEQNRGTFLGFVDLFSGVGFPFDDYADADYGQRVHHVAGRTDYRTRRWEWDVTADFCRHCGGFAARCR